MNAALTPEQADILIDQAVTLISRIDSVWTLLTEMIVRAGKAVAL